MSGSLQLWFEAIDKATLDDKTVLPQVNKHIGHLKIAFMWAFYYLKNDISYYDALFDILIRGGDTDTNAAIIGGLLGAAYGKDNEKSVRQEYIDKVLEFDEKTSNYGIPDRDEFSPKIQNLHGKIEVLFNSAPT